MQERYIVVITDLRESSQIRVIAVDKVRNKILLDGVMVKELHMDNKQMFNSWFGEEVSFFEGYPPDAVSIPDLRNRVESGE